MNFKQLVLEELGNSITVRDMTTDELIKIGEDLEDNDRQAVEYLDFNHGWFITEPTPEYIKPGTLGNVFQGYVIPFIPSLIPNSTCIGRAYVKRLRRPADFHDIIPKDSKIAKAIEQYELKKQLSPEVIKTFGDLIDEL